jgi:hypothetical protein
VNIYQQHISTTHIINKSSPQVTQRTQDVCTMTCQQISLVQPEYTVLDEIIEKEIPKVPENQNVQQ